MRPIGNRILVLQDEVEVENTTTSSAGLLLRVEGGLDKLTEEINKNRGVNLNSDELDRFSSDIEATIKEKKVMRKLQTGIVAFKGKNCTDELSIGDQVEFKNNTPQVITWKGVQYLLMPEDACILNLSQD